VFNFQDITKNLQSSQIASNQVWTFELSKINLVAFMNLTKALKNNNDKKTEKQNRKGIDDS
jgi:hypothetical protein